MIRLQQGACDLFPTHNSGARAEISYRFLQEYSRLPPGEGPGRRLQEESISLRNCCKSNRGKYFGFPAWLYRLWLRSAQSIPVGVGLYRKPGESVKSPASQENVTFLAL